MKIQAGNYFVNSDVHENIWITEIKVSEETKKEYEARVSGYHSDLKSALVDMLKRAVYGSETASLVETINEIEKALNDAINIIKSVEV